VIIIPKPGTAELGSLATDLECDPQVSRVHIDDGALRIQVPDPTAGLAAVIDRLRAGGVGVLRVSLQEPSLDDVFLHETGRSLRDAGDPAAAEAA